MRRAKVQEQFVKDFNEKTGANVEYIEAEYKPHEFMKMAKEKGLTEEPEGGLRCTACFEMRLEIVAQAYDQIWLRLFWKCHHTFS